MSWLEVCGVSKNYGAVSALSGLHLEVPSRALVAVLGPSGCGKTTLLRCIAGLERIDRGEIVLGDRVVAGASAHVPPHRRRIAIVPQEGALFPHLSVRGNVEYGLGRSSRGSRALEMLEMVGLAAHADRMPHQLSGGQQQRVAVARALAPRPSLVLFDEPFSALDAGLRTSLRRDVRMALDAAGATGILVTHDQSEALSTADTIAVMRGGVIVQAGEPAHVYRSPADPWVAEFLGEAVLLPATVRDGRATTVLGDLQVAGWHAHTGPATIMVRPEQINLGPVADSAPTAIVEERQFYGPDTLIRLRLTDGTQATARIPGHAESVLGATVTVQIKGLVHAWAHDHRPDDASHPLASQEN